MKALVYGGPGSRIWKDVPETKIINPEDAVVRVDAVTICGTDLHILKGDVPSVEPGRVLGHEAVGTVVEVGSGVNGFLPGDRVLVSCISACGRCVYCRQQRYGQCLGGGGWILGHLIDGTQAELVRVPFAERSMHHLPAHVTDEQAVMLADILPTSYEVGVLNARLQAGETVVIVGTGPIGLAAIATSRLYSPLQIIAIDSVDERRKAALMAGADEVLAPDDDVSDRLSQLTGGLGADVAVEAVGIPATFELCAQLLRPGGRLANIGVHGAPVQLNLERLWDRDVTITTGLVDTYSTPTLLTLLDRGRLGLPELITHRLALDEIQDAYDLFSDPANSGALKIVMFGSHRPMT